MTDVISRRDLIVGGGAFALFGACTSDPEVSQVSPVTQAGEEPEVSQVQEDEVQADGSADLIATDLTTSDFSVVATTCVVNREMTAGPFPLDQKFIRRDITEGYPGHPLRLGIQLLDQDCSPLSGATVEVWHADATGDYSAFEDGGDGKDEGAGSTFLRGSQITNSDGIVEFLTIYPGWYRGRAVHVHVMIWLEDKTVLTTQLFFEADHTAMVYDGVAYKENGLPDTTNESDGIAGDTENDGSLLTLSFADTGLGMGTLGLASMTI